MRYRRILCPLDFSEGSRAAMHVATRLAAELDAALVLAHGFDLPPFAAADEYPIAPETIDLLVADAEAMLVEAARDATARGAKRVSTELLRGVAWSEIVDAAANDPQSLIVMGTHGRTGLGRLLIGSVAKQVVRHAGCDVLVVRKAGPAEPFAHVLCPVDFSEQARGAVQRAAELVSPHGAVTLLHVVEVPHVSSIRVRLPPPDVLVERATRLLDAWADELRTTCPARVTAVVRIGDPAAEILAAMSADATIDLCATGSHGRTGIRRMLLGSVAEKIVELARCASLVVHTKARS